MSLPMALILALAALSPRSDSPREDSDPKSNLQAAREHLARCEWGLAGAEGDWERSLVLVDAAEAARGAGELDKARTYALELLDLAKTLPRDWNYGNLVHEGHRVLGHDALLKGDTAGAKAHLLAAGATDPASPELVYLGPNLSLANDLLAAGERETVVEYLRACARFCKWGVPELCKRSIPEFEQWIKAIEAGQTPTLDRSAFTTKSSQR